MACKFHAFMRIRLSSIESLARSTLAGPLIAAILVAAPAAAGAETADRNKPMNVEADSGRYDDLKQVGTFTGNVVVTKGSIAIRAGKIEIRRSPEGYQSAVATAAPGKLASFRQKREGVDETIEGEAERIEYDSRTDTVRFVNQAVIRRYRGNALADETAGSLITYDNTAEVFTVSGGASPAAGNGNGRVRAVLTPRGAAPAASEAASPPPGSPASAPASAPRSPAGASGERR